jgi:hypothetical protein
MASLPPDCSQDIRKVITPNSRSFSSFKPLPLRVDGQVTDLWQGARYHDPLRRILALEWTRLEVVKANADKFPALGQVGKDRFQIQTAAGYVERQHPTCRQPGQIKIQRLLSHQMDGYCIRAKSVHDN